MQLEKQCTLRGKHVDALRKAFHCLEKRFAVVEKSPAVLKTVSLLLEKMVSTLLGKMCACSNPFQIEGDSGSNSKQIVFVLRGFKINDYFAHVIYHACMGLLHASSLFSLRICFVCNAFTHVRSCGGSFTRASSVAASLVKISVATMPDTACSVMPRSVVSQRSV